MQVLKYKLAVKENQKISMPKGATPLKVIDQGRGVLALWAAIDETAEKEDVHFYIVATGRQLIPDPVCYIDTVQQSNGNTWHIFVKHTGAAVADAE